MEKEVCWKCEGRGKLRNNTHTKSGSYTFGFIVCDECKGTGYKITFIKKILNSIFS